MSFGPPSKTKQPDSVEHAYNYAIFLLGLTMRTEWEMCRKMALRGYANRVVEEVVSRLLAEKLIDDRNYAEVYLRNLKEYHSFGFYGIKKKMMEKHLPEAVIARALEDFTVDDEIEIGKHLMEKQLGSEYKKSTLTQEQKQKMAQRLKSRGFRSEVISKLLFG